MNETNESTQLAVLPPQALARKIEPAAWNALKELYDGASDQMIALVADYCAARRLDPLKKPVHIVPVWSNRRKMMVETLWPSIAETRITAMRTGKYAGAEDTRWGPTIVGKVGNSHETFSYPEWAQKTVYRMVDGVRYAFPGPRVYWLEAYATKGKDDYTPNSMWLKRTWGQLDKATEAAALRSAFPEELGGIATAEEMHGKVVDDDLLQNVTNTADQPALAAPGEQGAPEVKRAAVPPRKEKGASALGVEATPEPLPAVPTTVTVAAETPAGTPAAEEEKKKRVRRTQAQIAADKLKEEEAKAALPPAEQSPATEQAPGSPAAAPTAKPLSDEPHAPVPVAEPPPASTPPVRRAAAEWPKVVIASVAECVKKDTKDPQYPKVNVCILDNGKVTVNGEQMEVRRLGRIIFDPAVPELEPFTEPSDTTYEFTIAEVPSRSNPELKNKMIVKAEAVTAL